MKNEYEIILDATSDLPQNIADDHGLIVLPFIYIMDGKEYYNYLDHRAISPKDFYALLKDGKTVKTALITQERYAEAFETVLADGRDIICLCLSSGLSGSYGQAVLAAEEMREKYPERRIAVVDSLSGSVGYGILAYYAVIARKNGRTLSEAAEYLTKLAQKIELWVRVDDLNHLRRGGRVSGASAFVGGILSIKPVIHVDTEGKLVPFAKPRGRIKSLKYLVERMALTDANDPEHQTLFISHSDLPEEADMLADMVTERFGKREIIISDIGPVIGAHTGPGTVVLSYLGTTREVN